jgi:uncharacterized membrane protein YbhN (UPF0104 family)
MNFRRWHSWLHVAQVIITIGLIAALLRSVDWAALLPLLGKTRWELVLLSIGVILAVHLINVTRWRYLLQNQAISYGRLLICYSAGLFSNNFLPTGIGGDGVRAALLRRNLPLSHAVFSVGIDRSIGLLALTALLIPGLWYGLPPGMELCRWPAIVASEHQGLLWLVVVSASVVAGLGLVAWRVLPKVREGAESLLMRARRLVDGRRYLGGDWHRLILGSYMISVVSHGCLIGAHLLLFQSLHIQVPPNAAIWLVLFSAVSLLLPITVNGLGLQESIYVVVLGYYGVSAPAALGVGLLLRMMILLFSLLGGALVLSWQLQQPRSVSSV